MSVADDSGATAGLSGVYALHCWTRQQWHPCFNRLSGARSLWLTDNPQNPAPTIGRDGSRSIGPQQDQFNLVQSSQCSGVPNVGQVS